MLLKTNREAQAAGELARLERIPQMLKSRTITEDAFEKISEMAKEMCGINLHYGKKELVQARLNKRLRHLGMDEYSEYLKYLEEDETGVEKILMLDALTTNLTYFFREPDHFSYLSEYLKKMDAEGFEKIRIWSAGCSSGEEAFTLSMVLSEAVPRAYERDAKILATDISTRMLGRASEGVYSEEKTKHVPAELKEIYMKRRMLPDCSFVFEASDELKKLVTFHRLNLIGHWPFRGQFDVIFCRNVMIYFDRDVQTKVVSQYYEFLRPGGIFIVGHSESLTGIKHGFKYVRPSIYMKP